MVPGSRRRDDDDYDRPVRKKRREKNTTLLILLAVGGVGLLLLLCMFAIGVGVLMFRDREPAPAHLPGSWKGRFVLGGVARDHVYTFHRNGNFREEAFDLRGNRVNVADGQWHFRNGEIEIDWNNGSFENGTPHWVNANTMEYRIVDHSDFTQIGLSTTFRRQ
jgi:uncharacterized SAM-binding protein YcdF (DUF218 family)